MVTAHRILSHGFTRMHTDKEITEDLSLITKEKNQRSSVAEQLR